MTKEKKPNINDVKPCSTRELVENAWDLFLNSIKTKYQNCKYNPRLHP